MMSEATEKIESWAHQVSCYEPPDWDRLPEIYLYMDQVLSYMNKQLCFTEDEGHANQLTSSMVNNYVKDGVLERPVQKRYSREHLAMLMVICMLKSILPIQEIDTLLKALLETSSKNELYEKFNLAQSSAYQQVCSRLKSAAAGGNAELYQLAVELSVEANVRRNAAEVILTELTKKGKDKKESKK